MTLDRKIRLIAAEYPEDGPRESLSVVEELRRRLCLEGSSPAIVVVGTNGKTSTATYLARIASSSGARTGLYVSPHLGSWTERVRLDDVPCDPNRLIEVLASVHDAAQSGGELTGLRFFDLLTLTAELLFAESQVDLAVFEAGIGGRLDAVRLLEPPLVVLTSVDLDHAEILGERLEEVMREKLLVAPPGATVTSLPLGRGLDAIAERVAEHAGFRIRWVEPSLVESIASGRALPAYLRSAALLAAESFSLAEGELGLAFQNGACSLDAAIENLELSIPGRFERGEHEGVPYVLDAAHNLAAWLEIGDELLRQPLGGQSGRPATVLFSVSPGKRREGLAEALRAVPGLASVIVTRHRARPAEDPVTVMEELRDHGLEAEAVEGVASAVSLAFAAARRDHGGVVVFGSTYLLADLEGLLSDGR